MRGGDGQEIDPGDLSRLVSPPGVVLVLAAEHQADVDVFVFGREHEATRLDDACNAFHNYQLTWTPERIQIGVDGRVYKVFDNPGNGDRTRWPFDQAQYLILNIAMGGDLGGAVPAQFTADQMEVDYVRVYQR
ncbi:MAG: glycoside hydrolase family 16 protein [Limnohabitans sp.]|nr:MAG: glycoside hydrolase family 16 protein [Limnohabitans sp.]